MTLNGMSSKNHLKIIEATASELQQHLQCGDLSSVQIVETYLEHIKMHNHSGMKVNALISTMPKDVALLKAQELDEERKNGKVRGPLHGIPIIVKDVFMTEPSLGMDTTCGAVCFRGAKPKMNAVVINQLIESGMIVLGKATLTVNFYNQTSHLQC